MKLQLDIFKPWMCQRITREILIYFKMNEKENTAYWNTDCSKSRAQWEICSCRCLHLIRRSRNDDLTFYLKELKEGKQMKPKASRRKGLAKIRAEISEIDNRKQKNQWNQKSWFLEKINETNKPLKRMNKKERKFKLLQSEIKWEHCYYYLATL